METANNVIKDALKEIAAVSAEVNIPQDDTELGIFYLNALMFDLSINGINLGYTTVKSLNDEVTVPLSALEGIVKMLALQLSPLYFDNATSQTLFEQSELGFRSLLDISITTVAPAPYDYRFPRGSGNYDNTFNDSDFYSEPIDPILTEDNSRVSQG